MKKIVLLLILLITPLFFIKEINAALVIPTEFTELSDLADLPDVITRPVATTSDAIYIEGQDIAGHPELYLQPKLYFKDLNSNWYRFILKDEFTDHIKNLARTQFIADTGITPAYFVTKPQDEQNPYYLSWLMEYQNDAIQITFQWLAMDGSAQPIQYFSYTYGLTNDWYVSGNWEKIGYYTYFTDIPQINEEKLVEAPEGAILHYTLDGYTYKPVPDFDSNLTYNKTKLVIFYDTNDELYLTLVGFRPNKYNSSIIEEVVIEDLGLYDPTSFKIRYYSVQSITDIPTEDLSTISELPSTTGSIDGTSGQMGTVDFFVDGKNVLVTIWYDGIPYHIRYTFSTTTDMDIFKNNYERYYYTSANEKYIIINHGNSSIFTYEDILNKPFVPFTIWNLNTNTIKSVERYNVYMYSKKTSSNDIYAYFYVDNYIIDNLVSVSLAMRYRYKYYSFLNDHEGEWKYYSKILEDDKLQYAGGFNWKWDILTYLSPITYVGSSYLAAFYKTFGNLNFIKDTSLQGDGFYFGMVDEIQEVGMDAALVNEINLAYKSKYPSFDGLNTDLSLYKLYLGRFDKFGSYTVEIDEEFSVVGNQKGINIIEFTYETEGQLYTIKGEDINVFFVPGVGTDGEEPGSCDIICWIVKFTKKAYLIGTAVVWWFSVKYIYAPIEMISGSKVKGLPRVLLAVGYFFIVSYALKWLIGISG